MLNQKKEKEALREKKNKYLVVTSRSHLDEKTLKYIVNLKKFRSDIESIAIGSSLKFCLLAEGKVDCYPRFTPCMEWDTAAGHAIAKYAGKKLIDLQTKQEMIYNRPRLTNNWFIVE